MEFQLLELSFTRFTFIKNAGDFVLETLQIRRVKNKFGNMQPKFFIVNVYNPSSLLFLVKVFRYPFKIQLKLANES